MKPLLFVRVTYMERYDGPGKTFGGGSYIREHGVGGEVFNFKPYRGICYGYGMTRKHTGLNLPFINGNENQEPAEEANGVDVVFFARHPQKGQVIVGWYRDATVFHKTYRRRRGSIPGMNIDGITYFCQTKAAQAFLLPEPERNITVPLAAIDGKGFTGQANIWYPLSERNSNRQVQTYISRVRSFISKASKRDALSLGSSGDKGEHAKGHKSGRRKGHPDTAHNVAVEKAAIDLVWKTLSRRGFSVRTVEDENLGWDLEAQGKSKTLLVEVKGQSHPSIYFELTPNEYSKLQLHIKNYVVFVVCDALDSPMLYEFRPIRKGAAFVLVSVKPKIRIELKEKTGAVARE